MILSITGREVGLVRENTINLVEALTRPNAAKISARVVEVESAEWLWIASHSDSSTLAVVQDIASAFPVRSP